jgi:hypothetical protein
VGHVVLLGDSIFDNARYIPGGPAVIDQLRERLPRGWRATLLAVDGSVIADMPPQLARLPADATHLVVSIGGNNALENSGVVDDTAVSAVEGFDRLAEIHGRFREEYRDLLRTIRELGKPTVVCTIYDAIPTLSPREVAALSVFNDVILREAVRAGIAVIDLRLVCAEARDYSPLSPIEPSEAGGAKIAQAIRRVVTGHDFGRLESAVYGA